jgi:hypothetical protein
LLKYFFMRVFGLFPYKINWGNQLIRTVPKVLPYKGENIQIYSFM